MAPELVCWKCGGALDDEPLPLARLAECRACGAELHVCRLCEFYDVRVAKACRETVAEEVQDKQRANFCGYFTPRPGAHTIRDRGEQTAASADLEALFGDAPEPELDADAAARKLDDLFGSD